MNKKYLITGAILLLLIITWGLYQFNRPHTGTEGQHADYSLTAAELFDSFQKDEAAANKKYLGKVIEIRGMISSIQSSANNLSILIEASPTGGVNCSCSNNGAGPFQNLKKGDTIAIKGRCTGFLMDVNLVDCAPAE
jgi:hypothetical protein